MNRIEKKWEIIYKFINIGICHFRFDALFIDGNDQNQKSKCYKWKENWNEMNDCYIVEL